MSGPPARAGAATTSAARRNRLRLAIRMAHPPRLDPLALDRLADQRPEAAGVHGAPRRGEHPALGLAEEAGVDDHPLEDAGVVEPVRGARAGDAELPLGETGGGAQSGAGGGPAQEEDR